jgi:hypothetical protein
MVFVLIVFTGSSCAPDSPDVDRVADQTSVSVTVDGFGSLNATAPPETAHWGQLVGMWDCVIATPGSSDQVEQSRATWTWRYVLDGHAIQDVYIGHRTDGRPDFYGTGLRVFNPGDGVWEVSWVVNTIGELVGPRTTRFSATSTDEEVVMRRASGDPEWKVVFYDFTEGSFAWRNEPSGQTMSCTRSAA